MFTVSQGVSTHTVSCNSHNSPEKSYFSQSHFAGEETEAQRGQETFLGSERRSVLDLRAVREPREGLDDILQEAGEGFS